VITTIVCSIPLTNAQTAPVTYATIVSVPDEIEQGRLIALSSKGELKIVPVVMVQTRIQGSILTVGRIELPDSGGPIRVLLALKLRNGSVVSQAATIESGAENQESLLDLSALKSRLAEQKMMLTSWERQSQEQSANLERLQRDADLIANVGRIVDTEDEVTAVKQDADRLASSLRVAETNLKTLKSMPVPHSFDQREAQLTAFLDNWSKAVKDASTQAFQRLATAESELQSKVALVEATKNEHIDLLQEELDGLRRERAMLERQR